MKNTPYVTEVIGAIPNRLQLASGWIDQPFVSRLNPPPPGSMVVVTPELVFRVMDRSGCGGGCLLVALASRESVPRAFQGTVRIAS
ncbi:MAG: hypothetical protein ABSH11_08275 [Verrucomicrobiota bacterium]|jgi:hypothetical protein